MIAESVFMPGKVIIAGEHAVVYGKQALSASIKSGVKVRVFEGEMFEDMQLIEEDSKGLIKKAIDLAGGDKSLKTMAESQLPIGYGLGSSAAIAAAIIKAVREYTGTPIMNDELFNLTLECEKVAHGNPSGIDPATVIFRGLIEYRRGQPFARLNIKKPVRLLIVSSGKPRESTKEMVELVAANPRKMEIAEQIEEKVILIKNSLLNGEEINKYMDQNGLLLEELGVVGAVGLKLSKVLREYGCSVKITGAGGVKEGSGMLIVMHPDLTKIKNLLDNKQVSYFETVIGEI